METIETSRVSAGGIAPLKRGSMEQEHGLRERIVAYAGPRFFEEGFSRITTEELSRELGISKKTLYREFGTKEEIVRAVVRRQLATVERELAEVFEDENRCFVERLGAQLRVASRILNTLGKPFLRDLARYAPELWQEIQDFRHQRVFSRLEGIIQRGKDEGMIRPETDPRMLVTIITTVADNLLVPSKLAELDLVPQEVIRHMGMLVSQGILTAEGQKRFDGLDELTSKGGRKDG